MRQECHGNNSNIFSCFVDFRKAFESVPMEILLSKILDMEVTGKIFNFIQHIYTSDEACFKNGQSHSDYFTQDIGVRQECSLSPLLYNLFPCDFFLVVERKSG